MKLIGFANQYYTLWEYSREVTTGRNGVRYIKEQYTYLKNISKDLNKVTTLYPNIQPDPDLKGHTKSWGRERVEYPDNVFRFGRYEGRRFDEVTDYSYMSWYFEQTCRSAQELLKPILEGQGYHIYINCLGSYDIMTPKEYQEKLEWERDRAEMRRAIMEAFEAGELVLFIDSNPNGDGEWVEQRSGMTIQFDEVAERDYQGWTYYLPVLNGKAKRVKNKSIKITEAEMDGDTIKVHNFEVLK